MQHNQTDLLTKELLHITSKKRKQLIPWWIKVFVWIFLILGAAAPIALIFSVFGANFQLALYGFETDQPLSTIGIILLTLFFIKGITSFALLTEKDWAIKLGIVDSILGLALCTFSMVYPLISMKTNTSFRLEILLLIPYLLKLIKIKSDWENSIEE
jgi:hypothetical protein